MPASYLYKAQGERGKLGIFLTPSEDARGSVSATLPDGRTIQARYVNTNEGRHQYLFGDEILNQKGVKINYNGKTIDLEDSNKSYEGNNPFDGWMYRNKGDLGSGGGSGGGMSGVPGQFMPGSAGQYSALPAYIGGMFPSPVLMQAAPYQFTDPMQYAEKFGAFNRQEIIKNFDLSKDLALKELDIELGSLKNFVPAASAIKRQETSLDNVFNQQERTKQVDSALPGVRGQMERQGTRAEAFAEGRIPDSIQDRAFEVGVRSAAADQAAGGGFGANSSVARKASDLLAASQRINLSKYGDSLLTQNIGNRAALLLAPTQYSNAGAQVSVMPSISSSQLINSNLNAINGLTTITPAQGLTSTTQQNQFTTGLEQQTRMLNMQTENQFALDLFGYQAGYANSVAGGAQNQINTDFGLQQQSMFQDIMRQYQNQAQDAGMLSSIFNSIFSIFGGAEGIGNFGSGLLQGIQGILGPAASGGGEKGRGVGNFINSGVSGVADTIGGLF